MMMLAAVVLLVGFVALAGVVARVNQLASRTGTESGQSILDQAGPLARSIDSSVCRIIRMPNAACPAGQDHFNLTGTSYIRAQNAVVTMLEQMQDLYAGHGVWLSYTIPCSTTPDPDTGQVMATLSDGTVWVELRSPVTFPLAAGTCVQAATCPTYAGLVIMACG